MPALPLVTKLARIFPLGDADRTAILGLPMRVFNLEADRDIIAEGDRPTECNLLLEGVVCRFNALADGKRQIVAFNFPGDIFDAQSFLLHRMDHSIAALTSCRIAAISHEALRRIFVIHPEIGLAVWKDSLIDASIFRQWVTNVGRRDALARMAHLICEIYMRLAAIGGATSHSIPWPMTQVELADALGMSAVHANRTLQELRQASLVTVDRQTLSIHDWPKLKMLAGFDPSYLHLGERPAARDLQFGNPTDV